MEVGSITRQVNEARLPAEGRRSGRGHSSVSQSSSDEERRGRRKAEAEERSRDRRKSSSVFLFYLLSQPLHKPPSAGDVCFCWRHVARRRLGGPSQILSSLCSLCGYHRAPLPRSKAKAVARLGACRGRYYIRPAYIQLSLFPASFLFLPPLCVFALGCLLKPLLQCAT